MGFDRSLVIENVEILLYNGLIERGFIEIGHSKILNIAAGDYAGTESNRLNGMGLKAIPGFIDSHIHGAGGADVMDANTEALNQMTSLLPKEGTTSFLATTITQSPENIEKALANVASYKNKSGQAEILGVHVEGPFIDPRKAGAQPQQFIIPPAITLFDKWQKLSNNKVKTITMDPEKDRDGSFITYVTTKNVNVSAGHTNSGYSGINRAISLGVNQLTHLCNAMTGIHHRDIGAVGAVFLHQELKAELLADGIHVSPEMLQLIYDHIGSERLILITDALRAKGLPPGTYDLGGQAVKVDKNMATLPNGTLAGSIVTMIDAVKNMLHYTNATLADAIQMASVNPAKQLGVFHKKGSLAKGKDADILLIDEEMTIKYTFCRGKLAYKEDYCAPDKRK